MKKISIVLGILLASFILPGQAKEEKPQWDVNHPPGEAYEAKIDVDSGTWMSVDVSPNGKQIVFDLLGDLYLMPIEGGEAKALTHSIAWEMQPRFSPDGKSLAYTSDAGGGDNIWIMDLASGKERQLTNEDFRLLNSPVWSRDGQYIAARKHFTSRRSLGAGEIWLYHIAGGKGLQLNKRPNDQKDLGEPAFSADNRKVFFSRDSTPGPIFEYSKDSNKVIYEIFSIDRESGKIRKEVSGFGGSVRPTPSPDGKYLAFVRRIRNQSSLFLKDLDSGHEFPIYQALDRDMQETWAIHGVYPAMAWTPDSRSLVFWAGGKIKRIDIKSRKVADIPFHVKTTREMRKAVVTQVDPAPDKFKTRLLRWVEVSPKGDKVVFQALGKLYLRDLKTGRVKRLTNSKDEFEFYPAWSADGKWIVYTTWNDEKQGAIKKVRARGGKGKTLSREPGKYIHPRFSKDGKQIVYQKVSGGYLLSPDWDMHPGIYRMSAEGGRATLVTEDGSQPFFADNDRRIMVHRYENKKSTLVSLDLNGHDAITKARTDWATDFSLSPNGEYLVFRERYHLYIAPFTAAAKAIDLSPKGGNLPVLKLTSEGGKYISWSGDSRTVNWALGSDLHQFTLPSPLVWGEKQKLPKPTVTDLGMLVRSDQPQSQLLLSGAKIITMDGDKVIEKGDILIRNNRIAALGESGTVKISGKVKRIDVSGKTIIPGLIDVHWHGAQGSNQITPQQNWENLSSLAFGVTTFHDPSNNTDEIFAEAELARHGDVLAPRIFSTGTILYGARASIMAEVNSLDDAIAHLKRLKAQGAFSVKSYNQPRRDQRQQILEAARQTNMMVVPEGGSTFQHNLTMIIDGHTGIEHAIPVAAIYDDVKQLWQQSQTAYTPTLVVAYGGIWGENYWYQHNEVWKHPLLTRYVPKSVLYPRAIRRDMAPEEDYNHFNTARVAAQLQDLGVRVQMGAHGQREGLGAHWEMWMFAQGGMTPLEVLRTATIDAARYIGMDQHIGSLEVGKVADLVILDVDPMQDIYQTDKVDKVMLNGRLYEAETLEQIAPEKKKRKKLYFEQ